MGHDKMSRALGQKKQRQVMTLSRNNQQLHRRHSRQALQKLKVIVFIALLVVLQPFNAVVQCDAYHVGDVVDTDLLLDSVRSDVLRSQMPMFGISYVAQIQFDVPPMAKTFALQFEDGLWATPVTYLSKSGGTNAHWQFLERMQVQFVYSKSGAGAIHAVVVKDTIYSSEQRSNFIVEYHWVEEETVYLSSGRAVMFLAALLSCVFYLLVSCGIVGGDVSTTGRSTTGQSSVPKWD